MLVPGERGTPGIATRWRKVIASDVGTLGLATGAEVTPEDLLELYEKRRTQNARRLELMLCYAENAICRTVQLRRYFGEDADVNCGRCDRCDGEHRSIANVGA